MGLMTSYKSNNPDFPLQAKMVTALFCLPNDDIDRQADVLVTALHGEMFPLLN